MTTKDKIKIFQLMCSDAYRLGIVLFQQNELDFDEFVDYALHRAKWIKYNLTYIKYEMRSLNQSFLIYCRPSIKQMGYRGLISGEILDKFRGKKLSTILQTHPYFNYPPELDNEIYEDYMADKIYNEFKTNLKIEFDKLI